MAKRYTKFKKCENCGVQISPTPFFKNNKGEMECSECGYIKPKRMSNRKLYNFIEPVCDNSVEEERICYGKYYINIDESRLHEEIKIYFGLCNEGKAEKDFKCFVDYLKSKHIEVLPFQERVFTNIKF